MPDSVLTPAPVSTTARPPASKRAKSEIVGRADDGSGLTPVSVDP